MAEKKEKRYVSDNAQLMAEWDWEKNSELGFDPVKLTCGSDKKVWWICSQGHSYDSRIANRLNGGGCPYCAGKKVLVGYNDLLTWCKQNERLDLINEFDITKNLFSMQDITPGSGKNIWWLCPNGHSYSASLHHRIKMNTGCGVCSHKVFLRGYNDLQTTHPEIAEEFDIEKNGITPDQVMAGSNNKKYWFICPRGHSYSATLLNRKKGRNCPICAKEMHISFPEKAIVYYLGKAGLEVVESFHSPFLGKKEFDIFIPSLNIAIEYDGRAWHKNTTRDAQKDELCRDNGIKLIRIREIGCPDYTSSSVKYSVQANSTKSLEDAISFILNTVLMEHSKIKAVTIDIENDRTQIYQLLELNEKNNSLYDKCPQVLQFWDNTMNGAINPKQISFSSIKKVHFICSLGHRWISTAQSFIKSPRCPICSGEKILPGFNDLGTTHPRLQSFWSDKNKLGISNYSYGSNEIVLWKCDICHGEYKMRISEKAIKKFGCPYCNNRKLLKGFNDVATKYPQLAAEWSAKNDSFPSDHLPCSKLEVYWECSKHHTYKATILSRTTKHKGCPYCHNIQLLKGFNDLETCDPTLSDEFDIQRNGVFPSDIIYGGTTLYWWKCKNGHSYQETIHTKKRGYGCPICSNHRLLRGYNDLQTINPILASEFDISKNNGSTPADFFPKSGKKVWWKCSRCGHEWEAQIIKRSNGQGCPACYKSMQKKETRR
ncbi:MAG: zinc-ribbon domain-containing protein [Clostridia bacterium]|nr:zinc-ribbon domain-containing protein [Clostridia bacterium]